jgi:transposase InsO family protein
VNIYPFIEAEKGCRRNVKRACGLLKVSRAAFCQHLAGPSDHDQQDAQLAAEIEAVHEESRGRYGAPRVHAELRRRGRRHGRKRVARLMRQAGIAGRVPRNWKKTTTPDPAAAARADLIRRDFTADAAALNARWCGDITYIRTWEGWLFLATVIDIAVHLRTVRRAGQRLPGRPVSRADRPVLGQRPRRVILRLAERRADRYPALAHPDRSPPRRRGLHRVV